MKETKEGFEMYDYAKEKDVWYKFYMTYDDNYRHADNSFHNQGFHMVTAEELHFENVKWVALFFGMSVTEKDLLEAVPEAEEYVFEGKVYARFSEAISSAREEAIDAFAEKVKAMLKGITISQIAVDEMAEELKASYGITKDEDLERQDR